MPKVSVVIPNYNQTRFISAAIQSLLEQTYPSFEIIVVDDGSADNCREVVAGFGRRVRYIWQENQGLGGARNTGIRAAKGEFIGLLDADDQWLPSFLETMVSLTAGYPKAAVYYCCAHAMDADGRELPQQFGGPPRSPEAMHRTLLRANFLIPSTILMRKAIVVEAGLFEQKLQSIHGCEDWDLWLRLLPEHSFVGTSAPLVLYRLHDSTLSANPAGMQRAVRAVIEKHFGPDDGQWTSWPAEKRRAYGGVYRYHVLTTVQRENNWQAAAPYLRRALQADPTLALDVDLFYDLALGSQPPGYRGTSHQLDLGKNATHIHAMLDTVFDSASGLESLRRQACGTAHLALGLVAYNTGQRALCRSSLSRALYYRPELWSDSRVAGNLVKSFVSQPMLEKAKSYRDRIGA
jgi:glycosyltransferase involved in cell wall biosynthesis